MVWEEESFLPFNPPEVIVIGYFGTPDLHKSYFINVRKDYFT